MSLLLLDHSKWNRTVQQHAAGTQPGMSFMGAQALPPNVA